MKQFTVSASFKEHSGRMLDKHLPSDLLYSFGAALYEKSNRMKTPAQRDFFRKSTERVLAAIKAIRNLERQYYI